MIIRSLSERFWSKVHKTESCWEWIGSLKNTGYGALSFIDKSRGQRPSGSFRQYQIGAHRISWELHFGKIPPDKEICHRCDNRKCVRPDHLFLGTHAENMADMTTKGRRAVGTRVSNPGETNPAAKLTRSDVEEIRKIYANGARSQQSIADSFGVTQVLVSKIIRKDVWK